MPLDDAVMSDTVVRCVTKIVDGGKEEGATVVDVNV
jgi:hypothetical protein